MQRKKEIKTKDNFADGVLIIIVHVLALVQLMNFAKCYRPFDMGRALKSRGKSHTDELRVLFVLQILQWLFC